MKKKVKSLRVIVKADSATEFYFLPVADPITHERVSEVCYNPDTDMVISGGIFDRSMIGQTYDERIVFIRNLRELARTPLDEQRDILSKNHPGFGEEVLHILRTISFIDHEYFGNGLERFGVDSDMERYAKSFFSALLSVDAIRKVEERFYRLNDFEYDIHFDVVNREVIISKSVPRGFRGWLLSNTRRGYGIESWRKTVKIGNFH